MQLPPAQARQGLVQRYARLLGSFGSELGVRPLVQHTAEFFPDAFLHDQGSLQLLVDRMSQHAGLQDIPLDVQLSEAAEPPAAGGSCSTGGCGTGSGAGAPPTVRLEPTARGWRLNFSPAELQHPVALSSTVATTLGRIFLEETSSATKQPESPIEVTTELVCVGLGLGLLLLEGSYIYSKSCGGPSVSQLTKLSVGQLALACALFIETGAHSSRRARKRLGTTQKALLAEACAWTSSNSETLAALGTAPQTLAEGPLELREARSWLAQILDRKQSTGPSDEFSEANLELALAGSLGDADLNAAAKPSSHSPARASDPERDALAALVDEALRST